MPIYNAPIQDMKFILNDVFNAADFWQKNEQLAHVDSDTVNMILEEMSKFAKNTLLPINRSGDEEAAQYLGEGKVKTPTGFKAAFDEYAQAAGLVWAAIQIMAVKACQKW